MPHDFDPDAAASSDSGIYGLPNTVDDAKVVLLPVPWDATTSYRRGTAKGPAAILAASRQVDLHDFEYGDFYTHGVVMLDENPDYLAWNAEAQGLAQPILEAGGRIDGHPELGAKLKRVNDLSEKVNRLVDSEVGTWIDAGKIVGTIGGDHSVSFGAIAAHIKRHSALSVLHLDAHADLRAAYEGFTYSHASIFHNVMTRLDVRKLVQVGIRDCGTRERRFQEDYAQRINCFFDAEMAQRRMVGEAWSVECNRIIESLTDKVYVSFDIDGLDPVLCPNTGTPVPGGLSFHQMQFLLLALVRSGRKIVGFDLTEVAPGPNGDEWDGNVGARVLWKLIGATLRSQESTSES